MAVVLFEGKKRVKMARHETMAAASRSAESRTPRAEVRTNGAARESASDSTSGDDDDDDEFLQTVAAVVQVPLRKKFQEETATDWRTRMQERLQELEEKAHTSGAKERVVYAVPEGSVIDRDYFMENGFKKPIVASSPEQVGLQVPGPGMSLGELEKHIGSERAIRAIDVASQLELAEDWKLKEWVEFFREPAHERQRILNLLSLECGSTKLARVVRPPTVVKEIGWVEALWPRATKADRARMPRVQLYTLMSCAESYTDFHIDFCGSSVWYHLYQGRKIFLLIPPTDANLRAYYQFQAQYKFGESDFLADHMEDVTYAEVKAGETFLLPSGWIHAVYTPEDSIAFGGNFLTGYHIQMQLRCHGIEDALHVGKQFRFPQFESAHWYAAASYAKHLRGSKKTKKSTSKGAISKWEFKELKFLVSKLEKWLDAENQGSDQEDTAASGGTNVFKELSPARICKTSGGFSSPHAMLDFIRQSLQTDLQLTKERPSSTKVERKVALDPSSSPCPSTTSNTSSSISSSSSESSSSVSDSSSSSLSESDSDEPPEKQEEKEEEQEEEEKPGDESGSDSDSSSSSSSDSSSSSSSSSSSNHTAAPVDEANEDDGESSTSESEESDLENAYPRLPSAPVDALLAVRKLAKLEEMKITSGTKDEIIQRARKHQRERLDQLRRSKKKEPTKEKQFVKKQIFHDQSTLHQANSNHVQISVGIASADGSMSAEEQGDWVVHCSCGMSGRNIDDGTKMVECDKCKNWVHQNCALKPGRTEVPDFFLCFQCEAWYFECVCGMKGSDYDDGTSMIECDGCQVWQHTKCAGFQDGEELPKYFQCQICQRRTQKQTPTASKQKHQNRKKLQEPDQRRRNSASQPHAFEKATRGIPATATDAPPMPPPSPPPQTPASTPPPPPMPPSPPPPYSSVPSSGHVNISSSGQFKRKTKGDERKRSRSDSGKHTSLKNKSGSYREPASEPNEERSFTKSADLGVVVRPPLPITPPKPSTNGNVSSGSSSSTKRKSESARERLEKKLKKKKLR
ncbi:hypothetical protein FI667_g13372, partial [Globisporangium splendens]